MADTVQTLLDEIVSVVDVTQAEALTALNRRHKAMVAHARSFRKQVAVGNTVAGQAFYTLTDIIELYALEIAGAPYTKARRPDIFGYAQGVVSWEGLTGTGLIVEDANASGVQGLTLIPTPTTSGSAIVAYAAIKPADLVAGDAAAAIKVDDDFFNALVEGATATYLARQGEGTPGELEARFDAACEKMRRRARRRFRGPGPSQIRIIGLNA